MKKITLQKVDLEPLQKFLVGFELSPRASRGRVLLASLLGKKHAETVEEQKELIKTFAKKDGDGELITETTKDPKTGEEVSIFTFESDEDRDKYNQALIELIYEDCVILIEEYEPQMKNLLDGLLDSDQKLNEEAAYLHDLICTQLEEALG